MSTSFYLLRNFLIALILTLLFIISPKTSYAQAKEINADNYKAAQHANFTVINLVHTLSCFGEGKSIIGQPCVEYVQKLITDAGQQAPVLYAFDQVPGGGAVGAAQGLMLAMYLAPPVRGVEYLASVGQNFGFTKPVYAQATGVIGSGNQVVSPVFVLWQAVRNLAYILLIIIFIVVGFMIMFRRKLNPQTVVTIQLALPKLILGLVMITFSYFISSLIIDIAFAGAHLVGFFFSNAGISSSNATAILNSHNILTLFSTFIGFSGPFEFAGYAGRVISNLQGMAGTMVVGIAGILGCIQGGVVGHAIGGSTPVATTATTIAGCAVGSAAAVGGLQYIISVILYVVLLLALLAAMFSILMALIASYVQIVVFTILSPLQFLMASLPGGSAEMWFRNMLANVLPFPAVFAALYLVAYIIGPSLTSPFGITTGPTFQQAPPLLGAFGDNLVRLFLAYGILLAIPAIPRFIFRALTPLHRTEGVLEGEVKGTTGGARGQTKGLLGAVPGVGKIAKFI